MKMILEKAAAPQRKQEQPAAEHELVDTIAEEVSSVDRPAINEPFYVVKAASKGKAKEGYAVNTDADGSQATPMAPGKKKKPFEKADPPPPPAAPAEADAAAGATASATTNAEALQVIGAFMEAMIAVANEIEGTGQMDAPVAPEVLDALATATGQFEQALGMGDADDAPADDTKEPDGASAPAAQKEAAVPTTTQKRTFKLTGDKLVRFDVAMELLGQIGAVAGEGETDEEVETETPAAAPVPAKGKTPAAAAPAPAKPVVAAKKNADEEEMPGWAQSLAKTQLVLLREVKTLKSGKPAKAASSVNKGQPAKPSSNPVDSGAGRDTGEETWPKDFGRTREQLRGGRR